MLSILIFNAYVLEYVDEQNIGKNVKIQIGNENVPVLKYEKLGSKGWLMNIG